MKKFTFNLNSYYKAIDSITKGLLVHDISIRIIPDSNPYLVFVIFKQDLSVVVERLLKHPYVLQIDNHSFPSQNQELELFEIRVPFSIIDRFE